MDVTISDELGICIEITASTAKLTDEDSGGIKGLIMWHNEENLEKFNFHVDESCLRYTRVIGNLEKALDFLNKNRFISDTLYSIIKKDSFAIELFNKSSGYVEPNQEEDEVIMPNNSLDDEMMQNLDHVASDSPDKEEKSVLFRFN